MCNVNSHGCANSCQRLGQSDVRLGAFDGESGASLLVSTRDLPSLTAYRNVSCACSKQVREELGVYR
jgi:hypothetical protein